MVAQYFLAVHGEPSFIVDISEDYEKKIDALCAHESQFGLRKEADWQTLVNDPAFIRMIISRDQFVGSLIQVLYGEGIYLEDKMILNDLMSLSGRMPNPVMERIKGVVQQ